MKYINVGTSVDNPTKREEIAQRFNEVNPSYFLQESDIRFTDRWDTVVQIGELSYGRGSLVKAPIYALESAVEKE